MQRGIAVTVVALAALLAAALWLDATPRAGPSRAPEPPRQPPPLSLPRAVRPPFSPDVRVNLTEAPVDGLEIRIDGPYLVRPLGDRQELARGARLGDTHVAATAAGLQIGAQPFAASQIEIIPERSPAVWVDGHQYRGRLRLLRQAGGRLLAVNVLPLEEYLASVVDSEMPAAFPDEARRAQAIVARTYVLWQRERRHPVFDVYATTRSQRYLGYQYRTNNGRRLAGESPASRQIAADTAGLVCTRRGRLFCTYYSAVCGGRTVAGQAVFADAADLGSVPCTHCRDAALYRWTRSVPRDDFEEKLSAALAAERLPLGPLKSIAIHPGADGTADVIVHDGRRQHRIPATTLRDHLGPGDLPSPRFAIEPGAAEVTFRGRGHGHGVGLCQWGARGLALAGRSTLEIVSYYYPGSQVVRIEADISR